jgi:hypothetical protein
MGNATPDRGSSETPPRPPTLKDLAQICAELNRLGARYVVVGGWAIIQAGYLRTTEDIDLLIETTTENEARVFQALMILPDKAVAELRPGEVGEYGVVRVGDEVLVDLMKSGCNVTYADAVKDAITFDIEGVPVPFASPQALWRMKQTVRAKDIPDRLYLQQLLKAQGLDVKSADLLNFTSAQSWWRKLISLWKAPPRP